MIARPDVRLLGHFDTYLLGLPAPRAPRRRRRRGLDPRWRRRLDPSGDLRRRLDRRRMAAGADLGRDRDHDHALRSDRPPRRSGDRPRGRRDRPLSGSSGALVARALGRFRASACVDLPPAAAVSQWFQRRPRRDGRPRQDDQGGDGVARSRFQTRHASTLRRMQARARAGSDRRLTQRLARAFIAIAVLIIATLVATGACFAAFLGHFEPAVSALISGRDAVDEVRERHAR